MTRKPVKLVIHIPQFPPNLNKLSRNWYANHIQERMYAVQVQLYAVDARNRWEEAYPPHRWPTLAKATMSVIFLVPASRRGPLPDAHNLLATLKKSIDALTARPRGTGEYAQVGIGLIEDDSPEHLTWGDIRVVRQGTKEVTEITIEEIVEILR